jgi:limonene-1,2-epoxide hydrolase
MQEPEESVVGRFMEAMERGDVATAATFVHEDVVMEWPQSGERFVGRDNALAAVEAQQEAPTPAGEPRIIGAGDASVVMMPLRYGEEIHHYVGVFEVDGGRIRRTTEYFGAPFAAQEYRAQFAEKR